MINHHLNIFTENCFNCILFNNGMNFVNANIIELKITKTPLLFPKFGYNDEYELVFEINNINKNSFKFKNTGFKTIYIANKDISSILKFSQIKNYDIKIEITLANSYFIKHNIALYEQLLISNNNNIIKIKFSTIIDVSSRKMVNDEDDMFLLKMLLLSHM